MDTFNHTAPHENLTSVTGTFLDLNLFPPLSLSLSCTPLSICANRSGACFWSWGRFTGGPHGTLSSSPRFPRPARPILSRVLEIIVTKALGHRLPQTGNSTRPPGASKSAPIFVSFCEFCGLEKTYKYSRTLVVTMISSRCLHVLWFL